MHTGLDWCFEHQDGDDSDEEGEKANDLETKIEENGSESDGVEAVTMKEITEQILQDIEPKKDRYVLSIMLIKDTSK